MEHICLNKPLPGFEAIGVLILPSVVCVVQEEGDIVFLEAELGDGDDVVKDAVFLMG